MTPAEARIARALGECSFLPASWDKRFCRDLAFAATHSADTTDFTERQVAHMLRLVHKYRRQLSAKITEEALDMMEREANRRSANGRGALPDFTPARKARKAKRVPVQTNETLPLL